MYQELAENRLIRWLAPSLAAMVCLWPTAAAAEDSAPTERVRTTEQVRNAYSSTGFQVDQTLNWDWTSPPVRTFQVHDPARGRVLMVVIYPSVATAQTVAGRGSRLVVGYGDAVWQGNVALVQANQRELD